MTKRTLGWFFLAAAILFMSLFSFSVPAADPEPIIAQENKGKAYICYEVHNIMYINTLMEQTNAN